MTNREIYIQILHEVTGKPKSDIGDVIEHCKKLFGTANWEKEIPEAEAQELLTQLRTEKAGILASLIRDGILANPGNIQGAC